MSGSTDAVLDSMMADVMEGIDRIFEEASNSNTELDAIIGEERDGVTKVEVVKDSVMEKEKVKVMPAEVFKWAPFDFPLPKLQSLPYSGPGSFGQISSRGIFQRKYDMGPNRKSVDLVDTMGMHIGRIEIDPKIIIEVNNGKCVDEQGYVKIFPIGVNLHLYDSDLNNRIIIYAVKYEKSTDDTGKETKDYETCRYTTRGSVRREVDYTGIDPFESFSRKRAEELGAPKDCEGETGNCIQKTITEVKSTSTSTTISKEMCDCGNEAIEVFRALSRFWAAFAKCSHGIVDKEASGTTCTCQLFRKRYTKILKGRAFLPSLTVGSDFPNDALEDFRDAWKSCIRCQGNPQTNGALPI